MFRTHKWSKKRNVKKLFLLHFKVEEFIKILKILDDIAYSNLMISRCRWFNESRIIASLTLSSTKEIMIATSSISFVDHIQTLSKSLFREFRNESSSIALSHRNKNCWCSRSSSAWSMSWWKTSSNFIFLNARWWKTSRSYEKFFFEFDRSLLIWSSISLLQKRINKLHLRCFLLRFWKSIVKKIILSCYPDLRYDRLHSIENMIERKRTKCFRRVIANQEAYNLW